MSRAACDDIRTLLSTLVAGESDDDAAAVEAHLAECAACRRQAEAFFRQDRALVELAAEAKLVEPLALRIRELLQDEGGTPRYSEACLPPRRDADTPFASSGTCHPNSPAFVRHTQCLALPQ